MFIWVLNLRFYSFSVNVEHARVCARAQEYGQVAVKIEGES